MWPGLSGTTIVAHYTPYPPDHSIDFSKNWHILIGGIGGLDPQHSKGIKHFAYMQHGYTNMTVNIWGHHCLPTHHISTSSMQYHTFCQKMDNTWGWNGCAEGIIVRSTALQDYKTLYVHVTWTWQHERDNLGPHVLPNTPYTLNEISHIPPKMRQYAGGGMGVMSVW